MYVYSNLKVVWYFNFQSFERAMRFSYEEFHVWHQFANSLICAEKVRPYKIIVIFHWSQVLFCVNIMNINLRSCVI